MTHHTDIELEGNCEVCKNTIDNCTCKECPVCGIAGRVECYTEHYDDINEDYTPSCENWGPPHPCDIAEDNGMFIYGDRRYFRIF